MHNCDKVAVVLADLLTHATHIRARTVGRGSREGMNIAAVKDVLFLEIGCRQGADPLCNTPSSASCRLGLCYRAALNTVGTPLSRRSQRSAGSAKVTLLKHFLTFMKALFDRPKIFFAP